MKMSNRGMRGTSLLLIAAAAFQVTACASVPSAGPSAKPETLGGGYGIMHRAGLPARDGLEAVPEAVMTIGDWDDLIRLDKACHEQMDPFIPGMASQVVVPSLKLGATTALTGGLFGGLAAVKSFTGVSFSDYAGYMGGAGFGSALGSGLATYDDRYNLSKNYVQYACMKFQITEMNKFGRLKGFDVGPWAGVGSMRLMHKPTGMTQWHTEDPTPNSKEDANPSSAPAVPLL
jgi:hypothetical protein